MFNESKMEYPASVGIKCSTGLSKYYNAKLEFFFTPLMSIWLKNEYTDFYDDQTKNLLLVGFTLIF